MIKHTIIIERDDYYRKHYFCQPASSSLYYDVSFHQILVDLYAEMVIVREICDVIQFLLAFFVLLGNNPRPLYVPSGLMRFKTYPHLNGTQLFYWIGIGIGRARGTFC